MDLETVGRVSYNTFCLYLKVAKEKSHFPKSQNINDNELCSYYNNDRINQIFATY